MNAVLHVASAAIREHSRRKLVIVFVLITLAVTIGQIAVLRQAGNPSLTGSVSTLTAVTVFGNLALVAAIAVSMGNIGRPFSDGEAALVLARPVARWHYVLGRLLASAGLVAALCALLAVETQAVRIAGGERMSTALWAHWAVQTYNLTVLAAITTFFSTFAATPVIAAILAFVLDRFDRTVALFHRLAEAAGAEGGLAAALRAAWYLTPKTLHSPLFASRANAASPPAQSLLPAENSPALVLWSLGYLALILIVTIVVVNRKEVRG